MLKLSKEVKSLFFRVKLLFDGFSRNVPSIFIRCRSRAATDNTRIHGYGGVRNWFAPDELVFIWGARIADRAISVTLSIHSLVKIL